MAVINWLVDKSAYTRLSGSPDAHTWVERIEEGLVRISTVTRLEIGYSFRTGQQARDESASPPLALMPLERLTPPAETARLKCRWNWLTAAGIVPPRSPIFSWQPSPSWRS